VAPPARSVAAAPKRPYLEPGGDRKPEGTSEEGARNLLKAWKRLVVHERWSRRRLDSCPERSLLGIARRRNYLAEFHRQTVLTGAAKSTTVIGS
jgi:hypothetical protein